MSAARMRFRSASDVLAFVRTAPTESAALLVSVGFLVVGFVVALAMFWGRELAITGPGSVGFVGAIGSAAAAVVAVYVGRMLAKPDQGRDDGLELPGDRLRWYDMFSILAAYAGIALLGWLGVAVLVSMAFTGAPVYPFPGAVLVGVAVGVTAYVAFLSSVHLDPMMLSIVLALFLGVGAFASMLTTGNPKWWSLALSELGATYNPSAWVFNATVVIAGVIVTTIARYATARLPHATTGQRRKRAVVRWAVVVIGILLILVGLIPLDISLILHNIFAASMAVVFIALVAAAPWLMPTLARVFFVLGYAFVATIVLLVVFLATGYYNLTAVELVAAILMFSWIIVFLRATADVQVAHSR